MSAFLKAELSFPILFEELPVYSHWSQHRYRHYPALANIMECSVRRCHYREAFIVPLPTEKSNILIVKTSMPHHWLQVPYYFIVPSLYVVNKRLLTDFCASLVIRFEL